MTLGDKIKKYRLLKNKTQKQLGLDVGFKPSTADVRINQYESDKMAPKSDIRTAIANSLDIDIEAISNVTITSYIDLMHIFFGLEDELGMTVEKKDGKTALVFDDANKEITTLISYLNLWKNQKETLMPNPDKITDRQEQDYQIWKSKFHKNVTEYYQRKEMEIINHYETAISQITSYAKTTADITLLLRKIIESGLHLSTTSTLLDLGINAQGFTFFVSELLNPPTQLSQDFVAEFLANVKHLNELGVQCYTDMQMPDKVLTITYYIPISSFSIISTQINQFLEFFANKDKSEFYIDSFEQSFAHDLKSYYNNIADII